MFKQSLALRVLGICFLFLVLPLVVYSFFYFKIAFNDIIKRANWDLGQVALYRTISLREAEPISDNFVKELKYLLNLDNNFKNLPNKNFTEELKKLTGAIDNVDVFILDQGNHGYYNILASDSLSGGYENKPYFIFDSLEERALNTPLVFVQISYSEEEKKVIPYVYAAATIRSHTTHEILGYLLFRKNIEKEMAYVLHPITTPSFPMQFALLTPEGVIADASDDHLIGHHFFSLSEQKTRELREQGIKVNQQQLKMNKIEGNSSLFEFVWKDEVQLGALPLYLMKGDQIFAYTPKKVLFNEAIQKFLIIYIAFGVIVFLGAAFTFLLTRWFSHPLRQIKELMEKIRGGNLRERFYPEKLGFELNNLGLRFNNMLDLLLANMKQAEEERVKKESYRKEIDIAKKVQNGLLPTEIPHIEGVEIAAFYSAGKMVGGDFYDFFVRDDNLYIICVDTADRGLSPCLYSLDIRSFFRAYGLIHTNIADLMRSVNNAFYNDVADSGMFATSLSCIYKKESKALTYYSAGHMPGIIRKKNGEIILLEKRGPALGLFLADEYQTDTIFLESGDLVIFLTDGLIETMNERNEPFSLQRLLDLLKGSTASSAEGILEEIKREITHFASHNKEREEWAFIVMKIV